MDTHTKSIELRGQTVLGVWAHPDDEAYLSAGLMARTIRSGGRVACVHATLGERGTDDPVRWPPERLRPLRAVELRRSLAAVGVRDSEVLGYPDGGCEQIDAGAPIARLRVAIEQVQPDLIVTFGPDGITGHPDHVTVGEWTTAAWRKAAWSASGRSTLMYATSTESFMARHRALHERLGLFDETAARIADADVDLEIRLTSDELTEKRAALAAHGSQTTQLAQAMGETSYLHWYDIESFRRPIFTEVRAAAAAGAR